MNVVRSARLGSPAEPAEQLFRRGPVDAPLHSAQHAVVDVLQRQSRYGKTFSEPARYQPTRP